MFETSTTVTNLPRRSNGLQEERLDHTRRGKHGVEHFRSNCRLVEILYNPGKAAQDQIYHLKVIDLHAN